MVGPEIDEEGGCLQHPLFYCGNQVNEKTASARALQDILVGMLLLNTQNENQCTLMKRILLLTQGFYNLVTGVWPLLHVDSFMAVTGPKVDVWLVKMVALLNVSIGVSILSGLRTKQPTLILAFCTALSFFLIDTYYALVGRIWYVYLVDAAIQLAFLLSIIIVFLRQEPDINKK